MESNWKIRQAMQQLVEMPLRYKLLVLKEGALRKNNMWLWIRFNSL